MLTVGDKLPAFDLQAPDVAPGGGLGRHGGGAGRVDGQIAAVAALADDAGHIHATRRMVAGARGYLRGLFDAIGLEYVSGAGNFVMVRTPVSDTLLYRRLMREGVMVRTMTGFRYPNWIRVSLGCEQAMEAFANAFRKVLDIP